MNIRIDMPLPTPRSVTNSPSHMTTPVPAVIVITIVASAKRLVLYSGLQSATPWNSWPLRASATKPADCRIARPIVRYRLYWVSFCWPDWPSFFNASKRGITTTSS